MAPGLRQPGPELGELRLVPGQVLPAVRAPHLRAAGAAKPGHAQALPEHADAVRVFEEEMMPLIKMLLTKDYERGREMGLLGVHPEDFALPTFICPSKIEMTEIVKEGLSEYAKEYLQF